MESNNKIHYLKSIISTGEQYIDTGVPVTDNTVIYASFYIEAFHIAYENYFGSYLNLCACIRYASDTALGFPFKGNPETLNFIPAKPPLKCDVTINIPDEKYTLNGTESQFKRKNNHDFSDWSMWIFAKRNVNQKVDVPGSFKLYSFSMEELGEKKIDLHPDLDPFGIACLYDTISSQYLYNQGSGVFEYEELTS